MDALVSALDAPKPKTLQTLDSISNVIIDAKFHRFIGRVACKSQNAELYDSLLKQLDKRKSGKAKMSHRKPRIIITCSLCDQAYTLPQLKRHSQVHLREEGKFNHLKINGEYRCKICGVGSKNFKSKKLLSAHLRAHKIRDLQEAGYSTIVIRDLKSLNAVENAIDCSDNSEQKSIHREAEQPNPPSTECTPKHRLKVTVTQTFANDDINFSVGEQFLTSVILLVQQELPITLVLEVKAMLRECYELRLLQHAPADLLRPNSVIVQYKAEDFIKNFETGLGVWQDFKFMLLNNKLRMPGVDQLKGFCYQSRIMTLSLEDYDCNLTHILGSQVEQLYFQKCALQLLAGISNLHSQGIVHRYLKPCNVKVRGNPNPQIFISNFKYSSMIGQLNQDEFIPMDVHLCLRDADAVRLGDSRQDNYSFLAILLHYFVGKSFKDEVRKHEHLAVFADQLNCDDNSSEEIKKITSNIKDELKKLPDVLALKNLCLQIFQME